MDHVCLVVSRIRTGVSENFTGNTRVCVRCNSLTWKHWKLENSARERLLISVVWIIPGQIVFYDR